MNKRSYSCCSSRNYTILIRVKKVSEYKGKKQIDTNALKQLLNANIKLLNTSFIRKTFVNNTTLKNRENQTSIEQNHPLTEVLLVHQNAIPSWQFQKFLFINKIVSLWLEGFILPKEAQFRLCNVFISMDV